MTLRDARLPLHAGQVSLPGGAVEDGESVVAAALREGFEEIGVDPSAVEVLGELTPLFIPRSGFALHPVVGAVEARPDFLPAPDEVARILEVEVDHLADSGRWSVECWTRDGKEFDVPCLRVDGEVLWGATAMVLAEFLAALGRPPDPWVEAG